MRIRNIWVSFAFLILTGISFPMWCHGTTGDWWVNCSSTIAASQTIILIPTTRPGDVLGMVVVSTRSVTYDSLALYDSSGTTARHIQTINLSSNTVGGNPSTNDETIFNLRLSTGISVIKAGSGAAVTIYWHSMRGLCQ